MLAIQAKYGKVPSPNQQPTGVPAPTPPTETSAGPSVSNASKKSSRKRSKEACERRAAKKEKRMKETREKYSKALSLNQQPDSISAVPTPTPTTKVSTVEDSLATAPSFSNASQQPSLT